MTLLLALTSLAIADTEDWQGEFSVETRADAPSDARVLYIATSAPGTTVVSGPGAPLDLELVGVLAQLSGNGAHQAILPPGDGWEAGATYTIEVDDYYGETGDPPFASLTFTAGDAPAEPPSTPVVLSTDIGEWSEDQEYLWGCCLPTRTVTFTVESTGTDPWSYVQLTGDFDGPGQIAQTPVLQTLAIGIGAGTHELSYQQWDDGGVMNPLCFAVGHVSASGERGETETFCYDANDEGEFEDGETGCGCATAPNGMYFAFYPLLVLVLVRRMTDPD